MNGEPKFTIQEAHLHFAKSINGRVWGLLGKNDRSEAENDEILYAAYASAYHWLQVGTPVNQQRGEWLISHVHAALGDAPAALRHAERCFQLTEAHREEMEDFDLAYACEGLARAHQLAGHGDRAREWHAKARQAGEAIADIESRDLFLGDLNEGEWQDPK